MLERVASPFRELGLFAGTAYALHRTLRRISPRLGLSMHDWMVQPIKNDDLLPERFARRYETRVIGHDDPLVDAMPIRPDVRVSRREQDTICLGTFKGDELIGYIWLSSKLYREDVARCDFVITPPARSVFDFDLYIVPGHRSGLGFAAVWNGTNRRLFDEGIRYSYSRLDYFNRASARAHDHLGWSRVGRAFILRLWSVEFIFASISPRVFVSFSSDRRATYILTPDALSK
jgi:hypothetical protein